MTTTRLNRLLIRYGPGLLCASVLTFAGCAHTAPSSDETPAKEATAMTETSTNPVAENPTLTAEEIGKRFLKLIEGLESRSDLSVERVQDQLGIRLKRFDGTPDYLLAYSHPLGDDWYAAVRYVTESPSLLRGVSLDFGKPGGGFVPMPAAICELDFDYYHNALKEMGYRDVPIYGEIRELRSWRYYKGDITLSILPQNVVPGEAGRLCVKSIGTLN